MVEGNLPRTWEKKNKNPETPQKTKQKPQQKPRHQLHIAIVNTLKNPDKDQEQKRQVFQRILNISLNTENEVFSRNTPKGKKYVTRINREINLRIIILDALEVKEQYIFISKRNKTKNYS